ncbi:RidA family protein, partial [Kibdelosporangium lantanae]
MPAEITRINPEQLHETPGYHHITVAPAGRTAYLAGQCPLDRNGDLVGPEAIEAQVDQVVANSLTALEAAGAEPQHVVRSVIYVRSDNRSVLAAVWQQLANSPLGPAF